MDLSEPLDDATFNDIRKLWMQYKVAFFPGQKLEDDTLLAFATGRAAQRGAPLIDDASDPEKSAALYERLISEDRVDLLLGPYSSDITLTASRVVERHSFPMVATGAASAKIWEQGISNIFQIDAPAGEYMELPLALANDKGLKRIALVYADTEFPREVAAGARNMAASHGMQIVLDEAYPQESLEFAGIAGRLKAVSPDVVIGGTYFNDSVALVRAIRQTGLSPKILVMTVGPAQEDFGRQLGEAAEGVMGAIAWMRSGKMPEGEAGLLIANNFHPDRSGDVMIVFEPYFFINDFDGLTVASTHGSPWEYDTHVPMVFAGYGLPTGRVERKLQTVDIAPGIAALAGSWGSRVSRSISWAR